jgi:hypothetical protein
MESAFEKLRTTRITEIQTPEGHLHHKLSYICSLNPGCRKTQALQAKLHFDCGVKVFYVPTKQLANGRDLNYFEVVIFAFKDEMVEDDFLITLVNKAKEIIRTKTWENVQGFTVCNKALITKSEANHFMFSTSLIQYAIDHSIAKPFLENRAFEAKHPRRNYLTDFTNFVFSWLQYHLVYSAPEDENIQLGVLLDTICKAAVSKEKVWEIFTIYAMIIKIRVKSNMLGHEYGIYPLSKPYEDSDPHSAEELGAKLRKEQDQTGAKVDQTYFITADFFQIGFTICKLYWNAPQITDGHPYHPIHSIFLPMYLGIILPPGYHHLIIDPKTLYWQYNLGTELIYAIQFIDRIRTRKCKNTQCEMHLPKRKIYYWNTTGIHFEKRPKTRKILLPIWCKHKVRQLAITNKVHQTMFLTYDTDGKPSHMYDEMRFLYTIEQNQIALRFKFDEYGTNAIFLPLELVTPCKRRHYLNKCGNCYLNYWLQTHSDTFAIYNELIEI